MLRSNRLKKRKLTDCVTWAESNTITYLEGLKDRLDVIRRESEIALKKKIALKSSSSVCPPQNA